MMNKLPKGWGQIQLRDHTIKIGSGITPKGGSTTYKKTGILLIRSQNVLWGQLNLIDVVFIDQNQHQKMSASMVMPDDILLNITGASIGRACVVPKSLKESNVNQHVCIIRTKKEIFPQYFLNFILSYYGQKQIEQFQAGGNRQGLNFEQIGSFKLKLPPLPEQIKIAKILSSWDKAIETTEKLIATTQQQKKALMQRLLTGNKQLRGASNKRILIPIAKMGQVISGGTPNTNTTSYWDGAVKWLTPTDVTALTTKFVYKTARTITAEGVMNSSAKIIPKGSLLVCTRATIGTLAISTSEITTNQGFKNLVPNKNFCVEFLYYLFIHNIHQFMRKASGSTFLELSKKDFEKTSFLCPDLKEQQKIAIVLSVADREIETLQQKLDCLKQEKKAIMQQLLTGKRRVQ